MEHQLVIGSLGILRESLTGTDKSANPPEEVNALKELKVVGNKKICIQKVLYIPDCGRDEESRGEREKTYVIVYCSPDQQQLWPRQCELFNF